MSLRDWEVAVEDRLVLGGDGVPGLGADAVFVEAVPDEAQIPRLANRQARPYVSVWFGQRIQGGEGYRGICGVRSNAHRSNFLVLCCAHDGNVCRDLVAQVSSLLMGFKPAGQGELVESSTTTLRRPLDISGVKSRIAVPVGYSGTVDI